VNPLGLWSISNGLVKGLVNRVVTSVSAKMLWIKQLASSTKFRDHRSSSSRFSGFILEANQFRPSQPLSQTSSIMSQSHEPETSEPLGDQRIDQAVGLGQTTPEPASTEFPAERSEFSQRLASFGLGETPDPLLRPAKRAQNSRRPRRL
jgi:hypothetical protein